jgi:DNA helicase-2/ATP-dependent DNA helicase PcrA
VPFINGLESAGIPYEFLASSGLYRQPIVLDCLNFFKLLNNHHESTAVFRLLCLKFFEFQENDLQKITYNAKRKSISYYEAIKRSTEFGLSNKGSIICDKLINLIHEGMQNARNNKPHRVLFDFLENSGYLKYLAHEENQGNRDVIRQIYQLRQFFEYLKKYEEAVADARVADFLRHFNDLSDSGDEGAMFQPTDTPDSINIITIHKAKGLEFKYVFVVNLVEDRFPSRRRGEGIEMPTELIKEQLPEGDSHFQEERRLFYVATTRAKEKLYFTSANDYGGTRVKKISRFLDELGYQVVQDKLSEGPFSRAKSDSSIHSTPLKIKKDESDKIEVIYPLLTTFSFSQIKSYNTCPYQYKLSSIIKLPIKETHYFSFGNTMHNTLQEFYKRIQTLNSVQQDSLFSQPKKKKSDNQNINVPELKELLSIYEEKWIDEWYLSKQQREKYFSEGKKMLMEFYKSQEDHWTVPIVLEGSFKIKIFTKRESVSGEKNFLINGRIDRIDKLENGALHIIDYKTGNSKEVAVCDEKDQLLLYQMAITKLPQYKDIGAPEKLTLYYLKDNLQTDFIGKDSEIEKLQEKIICAIDKIHQRNFVATPSKYICKNCHFNDICEFKIG